MNFNNKTYSIIVDSFFGTTQSPKTKYLFYRWLVDNENNEQVELAMQEKFESYDIAYDQTVDIHLLNTLKRIETSSAATIKKRVSIGNWTRRIAAVLIPLILVSGITFFLLNRAPSVELITFQASDHAFTHLTLTCQSQVWLKSGSSILYAKAEKGSRQVTLTSGKAHFAVERIEDRPFYVNTDHLQINVLGTEFTVNAINNNTIITLASGSLLATLPDGTQYTLQKGYQLTHYPQNNKTTLTQLCDFYLSLATVWKRERLVFHESTFEQILKTINAYYTEQTINFSNFIDVSEQLFTIEFQSGESIESVLDKLKVFTGIFQYQLKGNYIYIYN